ncbi:Addiction module toxin, HicA family [uncultured Gammaproteobacteria bacterium]
MPISPRRLIAALKKAGCTMKPKVKSGHRIAICKGLKAHIPVHGKGYEISDSLVNKILADFGLSLKDVSLK